MRKLELLLVATLAVLALSAVATAVASAEDGQPALLTSEGKVTALEGKFTGGASTLTTAKKSFEATGFTATIAECLELEGKEKDSNLCHKTVADFTGESLEKKSINCRSEATSTGAKDAIGTVLALLDAHLAAGVKGSELTPLIIFDVKGIASEAELTILCGLVKGKVKGRLACLLSPGLTQVAAGGKFEVLCKTKSPGVPEEEECTQTATTCKELKEKPLEANLGEGFEKAAVTLHLEGSFNQGVFIDD